MEGKIEEDIIKELYYGRLENEQNIIEKNEINIRKYQEYKTIMKKIRKIENQIIKNVDDKTREKIEIYMECVTERESLVAEQQFKIGFKTAIKLIMEVFDTK